MQSYGGPRLNWSENPVAKNIELGADFLLGVGLV